MGPPGNHPSKQTMRKSRSMRQEKGRFLTSNRPPVHCLHSANQLRTRLYPQSRGISFFSIAMYANCNSANSSILLFPLPNDALPISCSILTVYCLTQKPEKWRREEEGENPRRKTVGKFAISGVLDVMAPKGLISARERSSQKQ